MKQNLDLTARTEPRRLLVTLILAAFLIAMTFTPLGFLQIGVISMSLLTIPVAVGAALSGVLPAVLLGLLFGITSFARGFGIDSFCTFICSLSVPRTLILCLIPRLLTGLFAGLIGQRVKKLGLCSYAVTGFCAACCNSILYFITMVACFWHDSAFLAEMTDRGVQTDSVYSLFQSVIGFNCIFEAVIGASAVFLIGWLMKRAGMITVVNPFECNQKGILHR